MSKASLRKELANFSREQLVELILETYSARKECKEYFDFFINPDSKSLYEKYEKLIFREMRRFSRGVSKTRLSKVKTYIKDFLSFSPDCDYVFKIFSFTLAECMLAEDFVYVKPSFMNGVTTLTNMFLKWGQDIGCLDKAIERIETLRLRSNFGTNHFKNHLKDVVSDFLSDAACHR